MDIGYYLKNFFGFRQKSLSTKITMLFIFFGIAVFSLTAFYTIRSSVLSFVNLTGSYVTGKVYQENKLKSGDMIFNSVGIESENLKRLSKFVNSLYLDFGSEYTSIKEISFFMRDDALNWSKIYFDQSHILRSARQSEVKIKSIRKSYVEYSFNSVTKYINITDNKDRYTYILKVSSKIRHKNIILFTFFPFLILFIVIIILSRILAIKTSYLIENGSKDLVENAERLTGLNFDSNDSNGVYKEFADLAEGIENTRKSFKKTKEMLDYDVATADTNQFINNRILKVSSGIELLTNIKDLCSTEFEVHTVGLAVKTSFKKGFTIYSEKKNKTSFLNRYNHLSDNDLPDEIQKRFMDSFEMRNDDDDPDILCFAQEIAGDSFGSFINQPLSKNGQYAGSLIITKVEKDGFNEDEKEYIGFLSKWIGASLSKLREVNERIELLTSVIITFSGLSDNNPEELKDHSLNVAKGAEKMAIELGLSDQEITDLMISSLLHDVGKTFLNGKNPEKHPEKSVEIAFQHFPIKSIRDGILYHHENWDGTGFPEGLKGDEIPLFSRIISIVNFYENAVKVKKWSSKKTLSFMLGKKGISFSPELVDLFISLNK